MALMNENRIRIPQVAAVPVDGDDGGIRGQMRMIDTAGDTTVVVCTTSDEDLQSTASLATTTSGNIVYTSIPVGDAGADITVEHAVGGTAGSEVVTVVGNAITVTGENGVSTAAQIIAAVEGSAAASALVTVADSSGTTLAAVGPTNLAGGAGTKAAQTFNTDLVLTARKSGSAGNDITLTITDTTGAANVTVSVDGTDITVDGDSASDLTSEMVTAINNSSRASKLVVASGGGATALAAAASAPLVSGASLAVWTTLNVS